MGSTSMPQIYLTKDLYDRIIRAGDEPTQFVHDAVAGALKRKEK